MNCRAVLLDMDGTLVDSIPFLKKIFFQFIESFAQDKNEELFQKFDGMAIADMIQTLIKDYDLKNTPEELYHIYSSHLKSFYYHDVQLFPGVINFLIYLKQKNIKTALVTSADSSIIKLCFESTGIASFIDVIVNSDIEGCFAKPSPSLYLEALKRLNVPANEAIAIEDSINGVKAAVSANIFTLHIFNTSGAFLFTKDVSIIPVKDWKIVTDFFRGPNVSI